MRIEIDDANRAYIYIKDSISEGEVARTISSDGSTINLDFDSDDRLLGIEILEARKHLPIEAYRAADRIS